MSAESKRSSYVRVAREVVPTEHLEKFRVRIQDIGKEVLPSRGNTARRTARSLEEIKQEGAVPQLQIIDRPAAKIHEANSLRVTLLEQRFPRSQRANSSLLRLMSRLAELDLSMLGDSPTPATLAVASSCIVESTHRHQITNSREFSLLIDDGSSARRLQAEYAALRGPGDKRTRYSGSSRSADESLASPLIIPFLEVSRWTDREAVDAFVDRVNLEGLIDPLIVLDLNMPELDSKIR